MRLLWVGERFSRLPPEVGGRWFLIGTLGFNLLDLVVVVGKLPRGLGQAGAADAMRRERSTRPRNQLSGTKN